MPQTAMQLQAKLMKDYYRDFSKYAKGRTPDHKVAWVTAFTPVEILEALGIRYVYPESYAAVIAASGKEQPSLEESGRRSLCGDCCSYSGCFEGCLELGTAPRGLPPAPDILIATNNQCNTLPGWWNVMAERYRVPLVVLDYPGESRDQRSVYRYVEGQHRDLIRQVEALAGRRLDMGRLGELIGYSRDSVAAWEQAAGYLREKEVPPTMLFDAISFLITSRCRPETAEFFRLLGEELSALPDADMGKKPVFWLGYPLWYHRDRYLSELLDGCRVCGSNYITWWSLDYSGDGPMEQLFSAYNYTFLNLSQSHRTVRVAECIRRSGAAAAVTLHNKSCKCDFVSAKDVGIPQAEIEIDMIDREFADLDRAGRQMEVLLESI